jgi:predicted DNA-binding transcriptional regulator YafY
MCSPTTRVLSLLELLQAHGQLSGPDLAQRLGVDARSLRRYVQKLEDLGIPVLTERGRYGGYRLMPGFKLPPMMFSDDEALALSLGLQAVRTLGLAATDAADTAHGKLARVMPASLQKRVQALLPSVALGLKVQDHAPRINASLLMSISHAVHAADQLRISYRTRSAQQTDRLVDPWGLVFRDGHWYIVGHCHLRQSSRTFRLDRVTQAVLTGQHFQRPDSFDALRQLAHGIASLPRKFQVEVLLKTDLPTAQAAVFDTFGLLIPEANGVRLLGQTDSLDWFAREMARLPFDFVVIESTGLQEELNRLGQRLQAISK